MRPKVTFRDGKRLHQHPSSIGELLVDSAQTDVKNSNPDLDRLLQSWEVIYSYASLIPSRSSVRATLKALLLLDEREQKNAISLMDSTTKGFLDLGVLRWNRQRSPKAQLPDGFINIEKYALPVRNKMIQMALVAVPKANGRPSTKNTDINFASQLAHYWQNAHKKPPTVSNTSKPSDFLSFAKDCFQQVGRKFNCDTLIPILRAALKKLNQQK